MGIALPVTNNLIARLQGLYWHDSISTGMIIVRDVFVASTGLVVLLTFVKWISCGRNRIKSPRLGLPIAGSSGSFLSKI